MTIDAQLLRENKMKLYYYRQKDIDVIAIHPLNKEFKPKKLYILRRDRR
jgi:hypothetical protein